MFTEFPLVMFTEFSVHGCLALFLLCFGIRYNILGKMCRRIYLFITWDPGGRDWGEKKEKQGEEGRDKRGTGKTERENGTRKR